MMENNQMKYVDNPTLEGILDGTILVIEDFQSLTYAQELMTHKLLILLKKKNDLQIYTEQEFLAMINNYISFLIKNMSAENLVKGIRMLHNDFHLISLAQMPLLSCWSEILNKFAPVLALL